MCKDCELKKKRTKGGYLCQVLEGVHGKDHVCPPSVISVLREV